MATTRKWTQQASSVTLLSTELNGLAAGALNISSVGGTAGVFNNAQGTANLDGYTRAFIQANLAVPSAGFAANSTLDIWLIKQVGTQYEDGSASVTPTRPPDVSIAMDTAVAARHPLYDIRLPPGNFFVLARNNQASGTQALAASGNTVTLQAYTDQGV